MAVMGNLVAQYIQLDPHPDIDGVQGFGPIERNDANTMFSGTLRVFPNFPLQRLVFHK